MEHWRNERVVYRRRDSGVNTYYEKIGIESKPKPPIRSLVKKNITGKSGAREGAARGKTRSLSAIGGGEDGDERPDMAQWDEETEPDGIVWDYVDGKELRRRKLFVMTTLQSSLTGCFFRKAWHSPKLCLIQSPPRTTPISFNASSRTGNSWLAECLSFHLTRASR